MKPNNQPHPVFFGIHSFNPAAIPGDQESDYDAGPLSLAEALVIDAMREGQRVANSWPDYHYEEGWRWLRSMVAEILLGIDPQEIRARYCPMFGPREGEEAEGEIAEIDRFLPVAMQCADAIRWYMSVAVVTREVAMQSKLKSDPELGELLEEPEPSRVAVVLSVAVLSRGWDAGCTLIVELTPEPPVDGDMGVWQDAAGLCRALTVSTTLNGELWFDPNHGGLIDLPESSKFLGYVVGWFERGSYKPGTEEAG